MQQMKAINGMLTQLQIVFSMVLNPFKVILIKIITGLGMCIHRSVVQTNSINYFVKQDIAK